MIPYARHTVTDEDVRAVEAVLRGGALARGPLVPRLEAAVAERCGVRHAVAVANGTLALHAALEAMAPDVVVSPALTFSAIANAAHYADAALTLRDVDPATLHLTPPPTVAKTRVTVLAPMDYGGLPVEWGGVCYPQRGRYAVLEDACHALGGRYADGTPVGSRADLTVFSLHPAKHVCAGEGGLIVTHDDDYAAILRILRDNGREDGQHIGPGLNYHLDEMSAALALSQLARLEEGIERRHAVARTYREHWTNDTRLVLPHHAEGHAYHLFAVRLPLLPGEVDPEPRLEAFRARLAEYGVGTQRHYRPLHLQPFVAERATFRLPATEAAWRSLVSLPMFPALTDAEVRTVLEAVDRALDEVNTCNYQSWK